jgi:hypothetical protein
MRSKRGSYDYYMTFNQIAKIENTSYQNIQKIYLRAVYKIQRMMAKRYSEFKTINNN